MTNQEAIQILNPLVDFYCHGQISYHSASTKNTLDSEPTEKDFWIAVETALNALKQNNSKSYDVEAASIDEAQAKAEAIYENDDLSNSPLSEFIEGKPYLIIDENGNETYLE